MMLEDQVRPEATCLGCEGTKPVGSVVCWDCWSRRRDITPFKYFDGTLEQWLATARKAN